MQNKRNQAIELIIDNLLENFHKLNEKKLSQLVEHELSDDIDYIYSRLNKISNSYHIYILINYLIKLRKQYAYDKLYILASTSDEFVRKEIIDNLDKIAHKPRVELLLKFLETDYKDLKISAIKYLAQSHVIKAVEPLISCLKQYLDKDEELSLISIIALGKILDRRAIPILEIVIDKKDKNLQHAAFKALSKFDNILAKKYLNKWISSENAELREFIYAQILKQKAMKWEVYIKRTLIDKNESVVIKQNILSSLKAVQTKPLFEAILNMAVFADNFQTSMLARATLHRNMSKKYLPWILNNLIDKNIELKIYLLKLLTYCQKEKKILNIYKDIIRSKNDQRLKIVAIECIGIAKYFEFKDFLFDLIKNDDQLSYSAVFCLCDLIRKNDVSFLNNVLSLSQDKYALYIEIVLRFIIRLPSTFQLPDSIEKSIVRLSLSEKASIRYLTTKAIVRLTVSDKLYKLIHTAKHEISPEVKLAAYESIIKYFKDRSNEIPSLVSFASSDYNFMPVINKIFRNIVGDKLNYIRVFNILLKIIKKNYCANGKGLDFKSYRYLVVLKNHINNQKALFLDILRNQKFDDEELFFIFRIVNSLDIHKDKGINFEFLSELYKNASDITKMEMLRFFVKIEPIYPKIEQEIFHDLSAKKNSRVINFINLTVGSWLEAALI